MITLQELKERRDVWPIVASALPEAIQAAHFALDMILEKPDLFDDLERKFRKGEAEHDGAWLRSTTDPSWLIAEAAEEIHDWLLYNAMFIVISEIKIGEREKNEHA
jgi:hypothetical protein